MRFLATRAHFVAVVQKVVDMRTSNAVALDDAYLYLKKGIVNPVMNGVIQYLLDKKNSFGNTEWLKFADGIHIHPITDFLYRDPFTKRALDKPRGYAGDAVMMDYLYGLGEQYHQTSDHVGEEIFRFTTNSYSGTAVRYRRKKVAAFIDDLCLPVEGKRVLSVAAGHFREAAISRAVQSKHGEFIAVDHDSDSLAVIEKEYGHYGVRPVQGSVRELLSGKLAFSDIDFSYASGLYDYLNDEVAIKLSTRLYGFLREGGALMVANFTPDTPEIGYAEAFCKWHMIYRNEQQCEKILESCGCVDITSSRDPTRSIVFSIGYKRS